jgi:cytochrome c553
LVTAYGCNQCHSTDGSIVAAGIPRIAGQKYGYLYRQLRHFRIGTVAYRGEIVAIRQHSIMNDVTKRPSVRQLKQIAGFYASRSCVENSLTPATRPAGVERCETCHGGERTNPWQDTPYLGGQDETYLQRTIQKLWRSRNSTTGERERYHRLAEIMFTDADAPHLDAYATYFSRLPCKGPVAAAK